MLGGIPKARELIRLLALDLMIDKQFDTAWRLYEIDSHLYRKRWKKRAPPKASGVTPFIRDAVKLYAKKHPDIPNREIGKIFNIDGGRVSEIMDNQYDD